MNLNKDVIVYSTPSCGYCYTLKSYLQENNIKYEEININKDPEERKKMEELSGQKNIPVTIIGEEIVIGWNKKKIKELLNL